MAPGRPDLTSMRAAFIERTGSAREIRYGMVPSPQPGPTDVLVDVWCTTVNPVDALIRSGAYPVPMVFPFVVGRDLVGRVAAAGPGAAGSRPATWSGAEPTAE